MKSADIIKSEGALLPSGAVDYSAVVWKHELEDFDTSTQLIVHESQEAIFFSNGQALDLFGAGRHTLETQNIPYIKKLLNLPTGGKTPFHCEVYFINKSMSLDLKWGTNSQIQALDPKFNIILHAGACGSFGVQIEDSRKFLIKLVGTRQNFDTQTISDYFRELIVTRIKTYLNNIMSQVSFVTLNSYLSEMSEAMHKALAEDMKEFGIGLINFFVSTIQLAERDYQQVQKALADASTMGIMAQAEKGKMDTIGYNWADQEIAEIAKRYASNTGTQNNVGGMMAQMPMAFAFGQMLRKNTEPLMDFVFSNQAKAFGGVVNNTPIKPVAPVGNKPIRPKAIINDTYSDEKPCPKCGKSLEQDAVFCSGCGERLNAPISCNSCGKQLTADDNFCPKCGTKREE